jgi:ActR/RegA family two-component response regulator
LIVAYSSEEIVLKPLATPEFTAVLLKISSNSGLFLAMDFANAQEAQRILISWGENKQTTALRSSFCFLWGTISPFNNQPREKGNL